jgi:hypothetical protein
MKRYALYGILCILVFGFFTAGRADSIEVYTFKKERVDQDLKGNRGYIMGSRPAPEKARSSKRTLIGVDIELPIVAAEEGQVDQVSAVEREEPVFAPVAHTVVSSEDGARSEVIEVSDRGEEKSRKVNILTESEDEWIK